MEERIGTALADGRLTGASLDVVIALGAVSITHPLADAVYRLKYSNDSKSYPDALVAVRNLASALNALKGWRLRGQRLAVMAKAVLDYWLCDTCPACNGRGWEKAEGAPHLTDVGCQACNRFGGRAGKRPYPWLLAKPKVRFRDRDRPGRRKDLRRRRGKFDRHTEQHKELLCNLEAIEVKMGERVIAKLAREVRAAGL